MAQVERALRSTMVECFREWQVDRTPPYTDFRNRWLLEHYNIVISKQANGVEKVGFGSRGAMIMFLLKWG